MKPIGNNIVIEPIKLGEQKTESGIVLPVHEGMSHLVRQVHPNRAKVIAVSESASVMCPEIEVGNTVIFERFGAEPVDIDDKEYLVLSYKDISMVEKEEI